MEFSVKQGVPVTRKIKKLVCLGIVARAAISAFVLALIPCATFSAPEASRQYIGNLGGAKFSFPADLVQSVEYDGDPGWGEPQPKERPVRTFASGFRSMGLKFRYSDFSPVQPFTYLAEPAVRVTIIANSYFGDGNFLDRSFAEINKDPDFVYTEVKEKIRGLRHFVLKINPEYLSQSPAGVTSMRNMDIFINEKNGKIESYIKCGNSRGENSLCGHSILLPEYRVDIKIHYKRELLVDWKKIEDNVVAGIKHFQVK